MTTTVNREDFLPATAESAEAEVNKFHGNVDQLEVDVIRYLRFMPAYAVVDGQAKWASVGARHYGVPLPAEAGGTTVTFDCPQAFGMRCMTCDNKKLYVQMGVWGDQSAKGCKPVRRVRFNAIDASRPEAGVRILEDGVTLLKMLTRKLSGSGNLLFDPFDGSVLKVTKLSDQPWREIEFPPDSQCSLDAVHPDALEWALPKNLPDLDESWSPPSIEQQMEWFAGIAQMTQGQVETTGAPAQLASDPTPEPTPEPAAEPAAAPVWQTPPPSQTPVPGNDAPASSGGSDLLAQYQAAKAEQENTEVDG